MTENAEDEGLIVVRTDNIWTAEELATFVESVSIIYDSFLILAPNRKDLKESFLSDISSKKSFNTYPPNRFFVQSDVVRALIKIDRDLSVENKLKIHKIRMGSEGGVIFRGKIGAASATQDIVATAIKKESVQDHLKRKIHEFAPPEDVEITYPPLDMALNFAVQTIQNLNREKKIVGTGEGKDNLDNFKNV